MQSFLEPQGLYTPGLRFAFTNITDEDFTTMWNKVPIIVKAHETIELSDVTPLPGMSMGHNMAVKMTKELVDKIMIGNAKMDEVAKNQPYYRSPQAGNLGVPAMRKVWEDQILVAMTVDEESPSIKAMRQQMRDQILSGIQEETTHAPVTDNLPSMNEFSDISKRNESIVVKEPAKTKKMGRPKKNEATDTTSK